MLDEAESAEGWFFPPRPFSRRNALELPYAEHERLSLYAPAYPCFAVPIRDERGAVIRYDFVCLAMAIRGMKHVWRAHPSRLAITGVPRGARDASM